MMITVDKLVAFGLVLVYSLIGLVTGGFVMLPGLAISLLPPLTLIWFADELGDFTGYVGRGGVVDQTSPPFLIAGFGWIVLIGMPIYVLFFSGGGGP